MSDTHIEEIKERLKTEKKVYVNDLSEEFGVSKVSVRKYLAKLEQQGFANRFYGGASVVEENLKIPANPVMQALAVKAREQIDDGDSIFIGSGRTCCVLAGMLTGLEKLTVVTNNITALPDLIKYASRVFLIGGEVTTTDSESLFSSWESPEALLKNIFVKKAFTSISGLDIKAGLTVDSIISTYIFKYIPTMSHEWYLMADSSKYNKISIYTVAELDKIHTFITDSIPDNYKNAFTQLGVNIVFANQ